MKANQTNTRAFTLIELLTVIAVISILGCLLLPAMARTRIRSYDAGCLSGLRRSMVGWAMYKDENNDVLLPNAPVGVSVGWVQRTEDWFTAEGNTNRLDYLTGSLAPYVNNQIDLYRCPADVIPSANGTRLRSRSMNGMVGLDSYELLTTQNGYNAGWRTYFKGSDLTCPQPKDMFIFCDESMWSLEDGYLQVSLATPDYPNTPANYHDGGCGFSFADGRAEIRKWLYRGSSTNIGLVNVPYAYGVQGGGQHWGSSVQDVDWKWLQQHSACHR